MKIFGEKFISFIILFLSVYGCYGYKEKIKLRNRPIIEKESAEYTGLQISWI